MEKQTVFIKRYPSKGELPKESSDYITNKGLQTYYIRAGLIFSIDTEWWLEEIEIPSEDYLQDIAIKTTPFRTSFMAGANFILNQLKSNTNETDKI